MYPSITVAVSANYLGRWRRSSARPIQGKDELVGCLRVPGGGWSTPWDHADSEAHPFNCDWFRPKGAHPLHEQMIHAMEELMWQGPVLLDDYLPLHSLRRGGVVMLWDTDGWYMHLEAESTFELLPVYVT